MRYKNKGIAVTAISAVFILALALSVWMLLTRKPNKIYLDGYLDDVALIINGQEYRLRDMVFYIAYEERLVESHAQVYSPDNTNEYWNVHTNGNFIRITARDTAMDMAIHDFILYEIAKNNGLALSNKERRTLKLRQQDFWYDFTDAKQQELGNLQKDIHAAMERAALAEKQQEQLEQGSDGDDYGVDGEAYKQLLNDYTYKIQTDIWERLDFGNITLSH